MRIALDFDETFTVDPHLWFPFIEKAKERGHDIRFVTMRYPSEDMDIGDIARVAGIPIIYTGREQKRPYCAQRGFFPHVWIDDCPEFIVGK